MLQTATKVQHAWKRRAVSRSMGIRMSQQRQNSIGDPLGTPLLLANSGSGGHTRLRRQGKRLSKRRLHQRGIARGLHGAFGEGADASSTSDLEYTSSSEQSCTTVIYLGRSHPLRKKISSHHESAKREMNLKSPGVSFHSSKGGSL